MSHAIFNRSHNDKTRVCPWSYEAAEPRLCIPTCVFACVSSQMFGSAATLLTVVALANVVLGAPALDIVTEKRDVSPNDYLEPHNTARAATGAA